MAPPLPEDFRLPQPYILSVPAAPAYTLTSLKLKCSLWPTLYTPSRKDEGESWSWAKALWASAAMTRTIAAAADAQRQGEVCALASFSL